MNYICTMYSKKYSYGGTVIFMVIQYYDDVRDKQEIIKFMGVYIFNWIFETEWAYRRKK